MAQHQGVCPICNSVNLDYACAEISDDSIYYPASCIECGAEFKEYYTLTFGGHYDIRVPEREVQDVSRKD